MRMTRDKWPITFRGSNPKPETPNTTANVAEARSYGKAGGIVLLQLQGNLQTTIMLIVPLK